MWNYFNALFIFSKRPLCHYKIQRYLSRSCTNANLLFRPVVTKVRSADPKGSGTSSQRIRGYISIITTLKITNLYS
jgi:hypothetical protein